MSDTSIHNIIFDLGGVILNIDPGQTVDALRKLGWKDFYAQNSQPMDRELFFRLENGSSSPALFREKVRQMIEGKITDIEIDEAWSAMILDIPAERIGYLNELKKRYRIFLLSNTNEIHRLKFHKNFREKYGYSLNELFEKSFYSHQMGLRKPDPQIYYEALKEASLVPGETLFIDDMQENTDAAIAVGMKALHIQPGTLLEALPPFLEANP